MLTAPPPRPPITGSHMPYAMPYNPYNVRSMGMPPSSYRAPIPLTMSHLHPYMQREPMMDYNQRQMMHPEMPSVSATYPAPLGPRSASFSNSNKPPRSLRAQGMY